VTIIIGFIIYGFGQVEWTSGSDSSVPIKLPVMDYSKFFNNTFVNVFMMINLILGLFLFDRFLANKRKQFEEEI
jgi:hypothetical protein